MANKIRIKSLDRAGLERLAVQMGQPSYRGRQLFVWLFGKWVSSFDEMRNLPAAFRSQLAAETTLDTIVESLTQRSSDGTIKSLMTLPSGLRVETVLIPEIDEHGKSKRMTVCVSSQVGCAMGCTFCATGKMGFEQNLSVGEIVDQVLHMDGVARQEYDARVSNIVFMGMGEPLMNYANVIGAIDVITHADSLNLSQKRITVSTVGLAKRIRQLADDGTRFNLAISLHSPIDEKRSSIMPVNRSAGTDLKALGVAVRYYYKIVARPVTYEYCMLSGFNDTTADADALARIASWAPCKVNLIMYNKVEGSEFAPTSNADLDRFIRILVRRGVRVTVRRSRGQDISAACGQLIVENA